MRSSERSLGLSVSALSMHFIIDIVQPPYRQHVEGISVGSIDGDPR